MDTNSYKNFYKEYYKPLNDLKGNIKTIIRNTFNSMDGSREYVEHFFGRIKSPESVVEKMKSKGYDFDEITPLASIETLTDIIGFRVVTHFVSDCYKVCEILQSCKEWKVVEVKDYISCPKETGYRSLHLILEIPLCINNQSLEKTKDLKSSKHSENSKILPFKFEIQIRTIAMDCWASLEHMLKYKKNIENSYEISKEFKICADEISSIDYSLQDIRNKIKML